MNSKRHLFNEAERLYVYDCKSVESVADELNLNRKTVSGWKEEGDWAYKRKTFLKSKQSFHEELFEFARKLMKDISADIDEGKKVDQARMFTLSKIIPMFAKVKTYEDLVNKPIIEENKGLTEDIIAQIEEQILGIPHSQNITDDENN